MCKLKTERDSEGEKRSSCKKKKWWWWFAAASLQPSPLPDWMFYERRRIRKRRQAHNTADRSLFMVDEQRCRREGGRGVCNKAECISPGMKLQRLGGGGAEEREGKAGEVLQILACERAQVHACSACSHMYTYVCVTWRRQFSSELLLTSVCWMITQLVRYERH